MASVKSSTSSMKFCFKMMTDDSGENTQKLIAGEVPWKIVFFHKKNSDTLNVRLACDLADNTDEWWIEAEGHLKILSSKEDKKPIEMKLESEKFMNISRTSKCYSMKYEDFVGHGYVENNVFAVECTIISKPLTREPSPYLVSCTSQQFIMKLENVDKLRETDSVYYNLRGVNWYVRWKKFEEHLAIYLRKETVNQDFTLMETTFTVKLLSFSEEVDPIVQSLKHKFSLDSVSGWGWCKFIDWKTFTDKDEQYVEDNAAYFDITIEVGPWKPICAREKIPKENKSLACCLICLEQFNGQNIVATGCGHLFCDECIKTSIKRSHNCPACSNIVSVDGLRKIFLQ